MVGDEVREVGGLASWSLAGYWEEVYPLPPIHSPENWGNLRNITKHSHNWDCLKLEEFELVKEKREKSERGKARV